MPVKAFLNSRFTTTHENQIFDELIIKLNQRYADSEELVMLIGNFYCEGNEIDAMIVKHDSISVIDFKNYGGKIEFSENDKWKADGTEIKGGNKRNPYIQIRTNKFAVLDFFKNNKGVFEEGNQINFGHISGIVLFHQSILFENKILPPRISSWFHVCDIEKVSQLIYQITSREINLTEKEVLNIARAFKVNEYYSDANAIKTKSVANSKSTSDTDKILTPSQKNVLKEIETFLQNKEEKVFSLVGAANSGKTFLIKEIIQLIQKGQGNYELLAPSKRLAEILSRREHTSFTSVYTKIYSGTADKEKEVIKIEDEEYNLFRFPLRTNDDSPNTVYIIDEAQLISDNFSRLDFFIFGSGKLLSDLKEFTKLDSTERKFILIGDDKQILNGNRELFALSTPYIETQLGLKKIQIELTEIIKTPEIENILENAIDIRNAISKESFNQFELIEDDESIFQIDNSNFKIHYEKELLANPLSTLIIRSTNKQVAKMNDWVRRNLFSRKNIIDVGDFILLYNNIRVASSPAYPDETLISNGEFGRITYVSENIEEPLLKFYPTGFKLKGRTNPTALRFREVGINFVNLNKEVRIKISEDFLLSESAEGNPDEFIALMTLFSKRNPTLKRNSDEFVTALRNDPFINAAKIKFGYAVTGHKAQGYKWKNVFVDFETSSGKTNESYFRWAYTSITRATSKLFLREPPRITPFDRIEWNDYMSAGATAEKKKLFYYNSNPLISESTQSIIDKFGFTDEVPNLKSFFASTYETLNKSEVVISNAVHGKYKAEYHFSKGSDTAKIIFSYNNSFEFKLNTVSNSNPKEFAEFILSKLYEIEKPNGILEVKPVSKELLDSLFDKVSSQLETTTIKISKVESKKDQELYTFTRQTEQVILNFFYDGEGFFTTVMCQSSNSPLLLDDLKKIINQLKPV